MFHCYATLTVHLLARCTAVCMQSIIVMPRFQCEMEKRVKETLYLLLLLLLLLLCVPQ